MKIWCQLPVAMPKERFGDYYDLLLSDYARYKNTDTDITIKDVENGIGDPALLGYVAFREANNLEIAKSMIPAEAEGYDAVAGAAYLECGVPIAANLLSIPVVDAPTASMQLARLIGKKFAVVTSEQAFIPAMSDYIHLSGFSTYACDHRPVRCMGIAVPDIFDCLIKNDYNRLTDSFFETAGNCVKDGADVIIVGCGLVAPILSTRGLKSVDGAPLIDPLIAALKAAEMMASLRRGGMMIKPDIGLFKHPDEALLLAGVDALNLRQP